MEQVHAVFEANTYGTLRVAQAAFPHMAARRSGLVINIGSIVGDMCVRSSLLHCKLYLLEWQRGPVERAVLGEQSRRAPDERHPVDGIQAVQRARHVHRAGLSPLEHREQPGLAVQVRLLSFSY